MSWLLGILGLSGAGIGIAALLGGGPWMLLAGRAVLGFLKGRSLAELGLIAVSIFALVQHFELVSSRHTATKWRNQFTAEHKAREADRKAYSDAQAAAKAKNEATIKRVEHEQDRITQDVRTSYARDLERLRRQAAPGHAGGTQAPDNGKAAGGADGDGLRVPPEDLLRAQEIELRLLYLQRWVNEQTKVDPNR